MLDRMLSAVVEVGLRYWHIKLCPRESNGIADGGTSGWLDEIHLFHNIIRRGNHSIARIFILLNVRIIANFQLEF